MNIPTIYLPVGPQGAGKSSFCHQLVASNPHLYFHSRDDISIELFGTMYGSSYWHPAEGAFRAIEKRIQENLRRNPSARIVLDFWNGFPTDRRTINERLLAQCGITRVIAWRFTTPRDVCAEWFCKRQLAEEREESNYQYKPDYWGRRRESLLERGASNYDYFIRQPVELDQGFEAIIDMDPLNPPPVESILI
jgi:predicted kinase